MPGLSVPVPSRLLSRILGFALASAAVCAAGAASAANQPPNLPVLTIASEGARPPYNYFDNNNELAGFEIDYGRALCNRMKAACKFVAQDWEDLIPGLLAHQYDAIMAALEITQESAKKIAFTKPYIRMPSAMLGAKNNPVEDTSPKGLSGKRIGVEAGGDHEAFAKALYKNSEIRPYASLEDAILDLAENRVDAVIGDKDAVMDFLNARREAQCCALIATLPRDAAFFGEGIGIGLRKEDQGLKARVESAMDALKADGTFTKIRAKYFNFEIN